MANRMTTLLLILGLCAVSSASALQFPLNVDCGTSGTVAVDSLNMTWVGDEPYVKSGLPGKVQANDSLFQPLTTLRYFPYGKKNCYSIPRVGAGNKILVRAWFYYGNYDGLESLPTFDLLFNGNLWTRVLQSGQNVSAIYEVVHVNKVDGVSVCLVRTNAKDVPFINFLEIKRLDNNLYRGMDTNFPLFLQGRYAYEYPATYMRISGNSVSDNPRHSAKKMDEELVAEVTIPSLLFLLLFVTISICIFKNCPSVKRSSILLEQEIKQDFSHAEIVEITNNFEKVLGRGGSGNVYYGRLRNGPEVAVKVLKDSFSQRTKEFVGEAKLLMTVHHRCLVSFVGYCEEDGKLILLYEYMSGGNLRQLLSGRSNAALLTWKIRLQIALRVATGLNYLHSGCYPPIIHRDVKTTNILLNAKMEAKVADFGLSKVGQKDDGTHLPTVAASPPKYIDPKYADSYYNKMDDVTQLSTVVAGTPGYIDPEYYSTNLVSKKSDVYSFGVVLFELITGHPPLFTVSEERFHIVQWVRPRLARRDIHGVADPKLRGQYDVNSLWKVADIAMSCTSEPSHSRPNMSNVVDQLKEAIEEENNCQHRSTDIPLAEVQLSSSSSYETSSSCPPSSLVPPAT